MTILLLCLFACGAAFIQRTTGFGFGIFIMTMLPYLMPSYGEATTLSGLLAAATSTVIVIRYHRHVIWRRLLPILATFLTVSFFAVGSLNSFNTHILKGILGITLISVAIYFWCFSGKFRVRPTLPTQVSLGSLSGIMGGLFGMQGPPAVLYFLEVSERKEEFTAITQMYFLIGNLTMTIYRAQQGFLTHEVLTSCCWALPGIAIGTLIGSQTYRYLSLPLLRRIVYLYIGISGIITLCNAA